MNVAFIYIRHVVSIAGDDRFIALLAVHAVQARASVLGTAVEQLEHLVTISTVLIGAPVAKETHDTDEDEGGENEEYHADGDPHECLLVVIVIVQFLVRLLRLAGHHAFVGNSCRQRFGGGRGLRPYDAWP